MERRGAAMTFYGEDLAFTHDAGFGFWARGATPGVLRMLPGSGRVVELGCGSGIAAAAFAEAGYEVFGVDVSEPMVQMARSRVPDAHFVCASLREVELPSCVAVVAMGEILSYAGIDDALLARVRSALSPGGLFLFDVAVPGRGDAGPARSWSSGDGWLVCVDAVEEAGVLTREIVAFRELPSGEWRRSDETHTLTLYEPAALISALSRAGFADARVIDGGYGPELDLPAGIAVVEARAP